MPEKLGHGPKAIADLSRGGASIGRGPNTANNLSGAAWSNTWPAPGATLDLDFANNRGWVRGVGQGGVMDAITFTRASNGNYVKPDGTLSSHANQGSLGNNLLTFPQDFDNAAWNKSNGVVRANADVALDGTTTADTFENTNTSNPVLFSNAPISALSGNYTTSLYVKADTASFLVLSLWSGEATNGVRQWVDLQNGQLGSNSVTSGYTFVSSSLTAVGDGWFRVELTGTVPAASLYISIRIVDGDNDFIYTNTIGKTALIWGAQLEIGSSATEYFPTNIGQPRFDWASMEVVTQRNFFTNSDIAVAVNGTLTISDSITDNVVIPTQEFTIGGAVLPANTSVAKDWGAQAALLVSRTLSVYVKPLSNRYIYFSTNASGSQSNVGVKFRYDTQTNTITNVYSGNASSDRKVIDLGDGLYRCVVTIRQTGNSGAKTFGIFCSNTAETTGASTYIIPTVAPTGSFITGGWQCEDAGDVSLNPDPTIYMQIGAIDNTTNTPLLPTPTCNGLLIEEARTNRILWCRDATQTQWVKTDIIAAKDQTGIDGVANAASSLTATSAGGTCIQTITLASGSRSGSVYLKRITGTGIVQVSLDGTTWSTVDLSSTEWRRIVLSGTVTNPVVGVRIVTSGDAVAMDYGQVEDGVFATSPILTTEATATRAVESMSMTGSNFTGWYNQNGGAFLGEVWTPAIITNGFVFSLSNPFLDRIEFGQGSSGNPTIRWIGTIYSARLVTTQFNAVVDTSIRPPSFQKIGFSFDNSNARIIAEATTTNGGAGNFLAIGRLPNNMTQAILGHRGYVRRLRFFSATLNESTMRQLLL